MEMNLLQVARRKPLTATVGVMSVGLDTYWEQFPGLLGEALERGEPSMITRYSVDLAQAFNKFYYEQRILDDDGAVRAARLNLTRAAKSVIATALSLIGVSAPERM